MWVDSCWPLMCDPSSGVGGTPALYPRSAETALFPQAGGRVLTGVILQPSYIPWRGYFHLIQKADVFVFYDDVQYDKHGWRNRNRVKTASGTQWLTIPVNSRGNVATGLLLKDTRIANSTFATKHAATLRYS